MGNCCDVLFRGEGYDDGDSEQRPLLGDASLGARSEARGGANSLGAKEGSYGNVEARGAKEKKSDEQTALNRILQTTADQVIDVGAIDSRGLEQRDYVDRARQYSARLALAPKPPPPLLAQPTNPLSKASCPVPPHACLAAPPPSDQDLRLTRHLAANCANAVRDVRVTHLEDLVVPFGI